MRVLDIIARGFGYGVMLLLAGTFFKVAFATIRRHSIHVTTKPHRFIGANSKLGYQPGRVYNLEIFIGKYDNAAMIYIDGTDGPRAYATWKMFFENWEETTYTLAKDE